MSHSWFIPVTQMCLCCLGTYSLPLLLGGILFPPLKENSSSLSSTSCFFPFRFHHNPCLFSCRAFEEPTTGQSGGSTEDREESGPRYEVKHHPLVGDRAVGWGARLDCDQTNHQEIITSGGEKCYEEK